MRRSRILSQARNEAEIVADGTENDVGGVAVAAFEIAAAEMAIGLHVSDHGFDRRAAAQLTLDDAKDLRQFVEYHVDDLRYVALIRCGSARQCAL